MPKPSHTFFVSKDRKGEFRWNLTHRNGNIVADSGEGYKRVGACRTSIKKFIKGVMGAPVDDVVKAARPQLRRPR